MLGALGIIAFVLVFIAFFALPFWWFYIWALCSRSTPVATLAAEMLSSDIGWSGRPDYPRHQTGIEVDAYSVEDARLAISGQRVPLTGRDKWRLRRAVKAWGKRQKRREAEQAAIELSRKVKDMAERVQAMADKVVPIRRDAA